MDLPAHSLCRRRAINLSPTMARHLVTVLQGGRCSFAAAVRELLNVGWDPDATLVQRIVVRASPMDITSLRGWIMYQSSRLRDRFGSTPSLRSSSSSAYYQQVARRLKRSQQLGSSARKQCPITKMPSPGGAISRTRHSPMNVQCGSSSHAYSHKPSRVISGAGFSYPPWYECNASSEVVWSTLTSPPEEPVMCSEFLSLCHVMRCSIPLNQQGYFNYGRLNDVVSKYGDSEEGHTRALRLLYSRDRIRFPLPTFTRSGPHLWQLKPLGPISVESILAAFGWAASPAVHAARRVIMADGVFCQAVGQSVHRVHGRGAYLTLLSLFNLSALASGCQVVSVGSGLNFFLLSFMDLMPAFEYTGFVECRPSFIRGHRALWSAYFQHPSHSRGLPGLAQMLPCNLLLITLDCSPVSRAKTLPGGKSVRSFLSEIRCVMNLLNEASAQYIIIETSSGLWDPQHRAVRFEYEQILLSKRWLHWYSTKADINSECGLNAQRRSRVFYFGGCC
jgi:hypothetical protein